MVQQLSNPPSSNKPHQQQQQQQQAQQHQQVQQQHHLMQRARRQSSEPTSTEDEPVLKKKKNYKDQEPLYILSQPSKISIAEAWAEYEVGLNGQPSVRQLEQKYKTRWRGGANHTISKQYTNRLNFYKFLEKLEDKELGLKFLEHYCAGNGNKNFRWLQFNMPSEEEFKEYCYSNGR
ncbi:hypothetical protein PACTADRAFT_51047 [Pachysolen tannophilus NRRL Y-2460]|uniref:Transcription activator GCR1-like domain-containing protein n=1 Tax=Pachysolen tannophilus NRRL Y-2460 TaxID=669874 RepID=A0A1E4TQZ3_PACTA|nr:hypothetical protein PACTADRAFT_51047 [Pachysolen tannophilus NRRL Y-2460]